MTEAVFQYPKGLRLDEEEAGFLEQILMATYESAKNSGHPDLANRCMDLGNRIRQSIIASEGVPPDLQENLQKALERTWKTKKTQFIRRASTNFLATMIRLHPDPARMLAEYILNSIQQMSKYDIEEQLTDAARNGAIEILERVQVKQQALLSDYAEEDDWPESKELLDFLDTWVELGITTLQEGGDPWATDKHVKEAILQASTEGEVEEDEGAGT